MQLLWRHKMLAKRVRQPSDKKVPAVGGIPVQSKLRRPKKQNFAFIRQLRWPIPKLHTLRFGFASSFWMADGNETRVANVRACRERDIIMHARAYIYMLLSEIHINGLYLDWRPTLYFKQRISMVRTRRVGIHSNHGHLLKLVWIAVHHAHACHSPS